MDDKNGLYDKEKVIKEALEYVSNNKVDNVAEYFIRNLVHIITSPKKYE